MAKQERVTSRRQILGMAVGISGLALCGDASSIVAQAPPNRVFTPSIILGPFYPQIRPSDQNADLTLLTGKQLRAEGRVVYLTGQVTNMKGEPVSGAKVSIWQANTHGRYSHKSDANPAPLDPNFQGFGVQTTDSEGRYRFKTIKPGAYPAPVVGMRAPHIHFEVEAKYDRLITQMFFPDEALNEQDHFLQFVKGPYHEAVIAKLSKLNEENGAGTMTFVWDIVLLSG
jgi:protocatechuate 3,4-dioxygenase beta subunit